VLYAVSSSSLSLSFPPQSATNKRENSPYGTQVHCNDENFLFVDHMSDDEAESYLFIFFCGSLLPSITLSTERRY
jgi:hypothetical protein